MQEGHTDIYDRTIVKQFNYFFFCLNTVRWQELSKNQPKIQNRRSVNVESFEKWILLFGKRQSYNGSQLLIFAEPLWDADAKKKR